MRVKSNFNVIKDKDLSVFATRTQTHLHWSRPPKVIILRC